MLNATLENDLSKGDGWALLKVPLEDPDGVPTSPLPGPGESYCLISVMDKVEELFLQGPHSDVHWDRQEIFYQVPITSGDGTCLVLRIPPDITDHMENNFFQIAVKCEAGSLPQVIAQADHVARRSGPLAAEENYALPSPGKTVIAWIHKEGDAPSQVPSWLASAQPDDLAPVPELPPDAAAPGEGDGSFRADAGGYSGGYGSDQAGGSAGWQDQGAPSQNIGAGGLQDQATGWQGQGGGSGLPVSDLPQSQDGQSPFYTPSSEEEAASTAFDPLEYQQQAERGDPSGQEHPEPQPQAWDQQDWTGQGQGYTEAQPGWDSQQGQGYTDAQPGWDSQQGGFAGRQPWAEGQTGWDSAQGVSYTDQQAWGEGQPGYPVPGADGSWPGQATPAAPKEKKGLGPLPIILGILFLLLVGGGALYYFKFHDRGVPDQAGLDPGAPFGDGENPIPDGTGPGGGKPPADAEPDGEGDAEGDEGMAPADKPDKPDGAGLGGDGPEPEGGTPPDKTPPDGGAPARPGAGSGGAMTPAETARRLLDRQAGPSELSAQVQGMEGSDDPAVVQVLFDTVRELAKYDPEYRVRLAAFYDPTDLRPTTVRKDPSLAWEEYSEAARSGASGAQARLDALSEWARSSPDAANYPEAAERIKSASR
ncbi:MAG: hypothetical protein LBT40_03355 [Deltaproteobacteria bacterium]|jgi:hypothetical protein|nr:hypothetical protein [Deltaproteobacteria bacterium]